MLTRTSSPTSRAARRSACALWLRHKRSSKPLALENRIRALARGALGVDGRFGAGDLGLKLGDVLLEVADGHAGQVLLDRLLLDGIEFIPIHGRPPLAP